jgi:hypothetical protein
VVAFGDNSYGACNIPALANNVQYVAVDGERYKTMLLRSDGAIVTVGNTSHGELNVPVLPAGVEYVAIACGEFHNVALRSDGLVEHWGLPNTDDFPPLPTGVVYVEINAGTRHSLARRSDGQVVVESQNNFANFADLVPPLSPGESYVEVGCQSDENAARLGPTSTYVAFASGCSGSRLATRLIPRDTPRIGKVHQVTLFDLPQNIAFMVFGWNRVGPISLAQYGMPGCLQHVSIDAAAFLAGANNQARFELPIPNMPGLVGLHFFNQAIVPDPAANALGAVVSDAAEGVIGHW